MSFKHVVRSFLVWSAYCGTILPPISWADSPGAAASGIQDVELSSSGVLSGQLVDPQGRGLGQVEVAIQSSDRDVASVVTDAEGRFQVAALTGGLYQVSAENAQGMYRCWNSGSAPPAAAEGVLLVDPSRAVVRGQYMDPYAGSAPMQPYGGSVPMQPQYAGSVPMDPNAGQVVMEPMPPGAVPCDAPPCGPMGGRGRFGWLANPWVIGGAVAIAIAIPLALSDDDNDSAS